MPLYEYECDDCGERQDAHRSVAERNECPPCRCGGKTKKIISTNYAAISDVDYYDENLQTQITSRKQRRRVMKEQNVAELYGKGWH